MSTFETITLVLGIVGAVYGLVQLHQIAEAGKKSAHANELAAEANQIGNLMAVLELENAIASARYNLTQAAIRATELSGNPDAKVVEMAKAMQAAADEQLLNVTDRLCTCIVRGHVDEETYRSDYRPFISEMVTTYKEFLGADTRHPYIVRVHGAWSVDKSCVEKPATKA